MTSRSLRRALAPWGLGCGVAVLGCSGTEPGGDAEACTAHGVIYERDDRVPLVDHPDPAWLELGDACVMALIPPEHLSLEPSPVVQAPRQSEAFELCPGQAGEALPAAAACTGIVIGDDTVLTAAHCVPSCSGWYVSGYRTEATGELRALAPSDVYTCAEELARGVSVEPDGAYVDVSWVRLNRRLPRPCLPAPRDGDPALGEPLVVVGTPLGGPLQIDAGALVVDARRNAPDYLLASSDTFAGSSGSPVFDAGRRLVGYALGGQPDFERDVALGCNTFRVIDSAVEAGERVARLAPAVDLLCAVQPEHAACSLAARPAVNGCEP